ncbi:4-hydroxyphenylacetate degradation bifunctional isomerase/decarboxylase HpaG [Methanobrevibacter ruminantium M1]|uniref:4-hydroxyphenylacetate degradation bifunctional isomerase/decarboxylase HpaG n=1 Tax=Methanobrevibacter ruminantium (strain ATCC 35063 / DSM 1093 / JCM 13430 / OCM 146 / M1) TaxID=634498 RepID=D3E4G3_METRM|nr:fumarylacetoacetate hydrolase family protein [Methanobrevibacter ruminantium]ADC45859.1 4-hydroxyphenylacetate degradation bifunctional isomerase/decarboxylase HpaG [Methanobrevibacter ruminantium M1]
MKFLRFKKKINELGKDNSIKIGFYDGEKIIELKGDILDYFNSNLDEIKENMIESYSLEDIEIEAPVNPSKIICIGLNYKDHAKELNLELPKKPVIFIKPNSALNSTEKNIIFPNISKQVDYEGELAVVIGKATKKVSKEEADDYIFGYTIINDVTARDFTLGDGQWTRGKSCDGFAPIGPFIETDLDPLNQRIVTKVNGEIKQNSNTSMMIFSPQEIIEFISQTTTLNPGDIIATGTPPGVGPMDAGSTVEVSIEEIGILKNYLIKEE